MKLPKKIYKNIELRYKKKNLSYQVLELYQKIDNLYKEATKNYSKLSKPCVCSQKAYISTWINREVGNDIAKKSVGGPFNLNNPPDNFKATADFLKNYPPELIMKAKKSSDIWNQIDFDDMKNKWLKMIGERNNFSFNKGYKSRIDMILDKLKISKSEYNKFLKITAERDDKSKNYNYCSVCNIDSFPFNDIEEVLEFFVNKYPFFKKNKEKIKINLGEFSETEYLKEKDLFSITLNKNVNTNHQLMDLIHELAHVLFMTKILKKDDFILWKGAYFWEKSAIKIEMNFLKKYFPTLYQTKIDSLPPIIGRTLFEIKIYQDPNENPDKFWKKYVNKKNSHGYLLNQNILYNSFTDLIYAIAYSNIL